MFRGGIWGLSAGLAIWGLAFNWANKALEARGRQAELTGQYAADPDLVLREIFR